MRILFAGVVLGAISLLVACSGVSSTLADDGDAGSSGDGGSAKDGSTGDGGDGGGACVNPTHGEACVTGEAVCGQVGNGNPCCDQAWQCLDGKWQSEAAECLCVTASATCGDHTCTPGQYCQVQPPGIALEDGGVPPTGYTCMDPPSSCAGNDTCACLEASPPCSIASCTDSNAEVSTIPTVTCIGE